MVYEIQATAMMEGGTFSYAMISSTAPSSPGRTSSATNPAEEFYFSEPTSPTHFLKSELQIANSGTDLRKVWEDKRTFNPGKEPKKLEKNDDNDEEVSLCLNHSFEFEFTSSRFSETDSDPVSADELFLNGQIRPVGLQRPPSIQQTQSFKSTVADSNGGDPFRSFNGHRNLQPNGYSSGLGSLDTRKEEFSGSFSKNRGKDGVQSKSKGRSSTLRNFLFDERKKSVPEEEFVGLKDKDSNFMKSRSSRCSKRWSLKDFLYRSASEGRADGKDRLWRLTLNPPAKQAQKHSMKKPEAVSNHGKQSQGKSTGTNSIKTKHSGSGKRNEMKIQAEFKNGSGKKIPQSAHELHYKANRAQSDELRRKSFLPYRQGLLGCLGFTTNTYTTMTGLTRSLHPFS